MKSIHDAQHPIRQCAIKIIEEVIVPILNTRGDGGTNVGLHGSEYYIAEDKITDIIYTLIKGTNCDTIESI